MTSVRKPDFDTLPLCLQPNYFADYLSPQQEYCLFLDIDGTLAEFTLNPKDSFIPKATLNILQRIQHYGVQIAIVTGRSLAEAKQMLSPLQLPIAATHGLEIDFANDANNDHDKESDSLRSNIRPVDSTELAAIEQAIRQACVSHDDFTIENKPYSVALHYRQNPDLADVAYSIVSESIKHDPNWVLKQGKYVWEVVPKGVNKGSAILTLLNKMQSNAKPCYKLCPIFIGDDITDEAGFAAVQSVNCSNGIGEAAKINRDILPASQTSIKGLGIKVGIEPTCAHYYVYTIYDMVVLLECFLRFKQQYNASSIDLTNATPQPSKK